MSGGSLISQLWWTNPASAAMDSYCRLTPEAIAEKENLRQSFLKGDGKAQSQYQELLKQQGEMLRQCRSRTWPQDQAIWLRVYPCDISPGAIDRILDQVVNKGYNKVFVEVFFDGQVLLPPADNPTPWIPVVRTPGAEKVDLLAQTIQKGRERGLKVYAWLFTMNFGYNYAQRPDRQGVLARNKKGENSITFVHDQSQAFIDPYNKQAQSDYYRLVEAVLKRRPDGVLFDYVRYPRGTGAYSLVSKVEDLWLYGDASLQALYQRAQNNKGRELITRYVTRGNITAKDLAEVNSLYPQEGTPLWQGRDASGGSGLSILRLDLWYLTVAHAAQGVIDFVSLASSAVERQGIPTGAVFFPEGNESVGQIGFDSRLQAWDKFPVYLERHPMSYGICGNTDCIVEQVKRVVSMTSGQTKIMPAIAGLWGQEYKSRPSLEAQMQAIRAAFPQISAMSHFAFSWQEPQIESDRRSCNL
jgi:hypothetical protein